MNWRRIKSQLKTINLLQDDTKAQRQIFYVFPSFSYEDQLFVQVEEELHKQFLEQYELDKD